MRWIAMVGWLAVTVAALTGCTQQCFVTEADWKHYQEIMPANLDVDPTASLPPAEILTHTPATVLNPEQRVPWYLTLHEAMARALEQGTTGIQSVRQPGLIQDDLMGPNLWQNLETQSDANRVLAMNPAIRGSEIEASMAKFDPLWVSTMGWSYVDQQVQGLGSFQNGQFATFDSTLVKPLATGGIAGITFTDNYSFLSHPPTAFPILNPAYLARVDVIFDHPLWQSFGTEINQLLSRHPGSVVGSNLSFAAATYYNSHLSNINQGLGAGAGFGNSGILITRIRFDQSRAELERVVNYKLLNAEVAYWNLYGAYVNFYAAEQGLRQAYQTWKVLEARARAGAGAAQQQQGQNIMALVAQSLAQYNEFRANRLQALGQVLENERQLRGLMGLQPEDGKQIIPVDTPTLAPFIPDFKCALEEAITKRPELVAGREELRARQLDIIIQKNYLKPDIRFRSRYGVSGLGSRMDGDGEILDASTGQFRTNNSLRNLAGTHFSDWNVGLIANIPIGWRFEHAAVRRARLGLAQAWYALLNEQKKAERYLAKTYREVIQWNNEIQLRRAQRLASARELKVRETEIIAGLQVVGSPFLLDAQRRWATALQQEYQAIVNYNNSLAAFQFAKGTIQPYNNVAINEGPLPQCAMVRAVVHEEARSKALVLRERSAPVPHEPLNVEGGSFGLPELPNHQAPSLPSLFEGAAQSAGAPVTALPQGGAEVLPVPPGASLPPGSTVMPPPGMAAPANLGAGGLPDMNGTPYNAQPSRSGPAGNALPLVPSAPSTGEVPMLPPAGSIPGGISRGGPMTIPVSDASPVALSQFQNAMSSVPTSPPLLDDPSLAPPGAH